MLLTRVGRRGQITIPREIRRRTRIKEGDQVAFIFQGERIVFQPVTQTLLDLRGSVPVPGEQDFSAIRRQVLADHAERVVKDEA